MGFRDESEPHEARVFFSLRTIAESLVVSLRLESDWDEVQSSELDWKRSEDTFYSTVFG